MAEEVVVVDEASKVDCELVVRVVESVVVEAVEEESEAVEAVETFVVEEVVDSVG